MKLLLPTFFIIALKFNSNGQAPKESSYWLYNLPVIENPDNLFDALLNDTRFIREKAIDTENEYTFGEHTYLGKIIKPNLPDSLNKVDSSFVELTWGFSRSISPKKSRKTYSGNIKILRIEYFMRDSALIARIFDIIEKQLSQNFLEKNYLQSGSKENTISGTGITITYVNNKKRLQEFNILKKTYLNENKSLCLEFVINQN